MSTLGSAMTPNSIQPNVASHYLLKWGEHSSNLINTFNDLILNESLTDVTLGCDGVMIKAHKIVLSANSNYFRDLFMATPCKHPIVVLKDIKIEDFKALLDFMYKGEVNVSAAQMGALIKTAESLRVKGLTFLNDEKNESEIPSQQPSANNNSNEVPLSFGGTPNGTLGGTSNANSPSDGQCFNTSSTGQPSSPGGCKKRKKKRNTGGTNIPNSIANNASNPSSAVTSNNNGLRTTSRVISSVSNVGQISMPLESVTSPHIHAPSTSLVVRNEVDDDLVPASNSDGEMDANSMDFDDDLNRVKRSGRPDRDPLVSAAVAQLSNSILPSTSSSMTLVSVANTSPIVPMVAESSMSSRGQLRRPTVQQQSTQPLSQPQQQQQQQTQPTAHTSSIQRDLVSAESSMAGDTVSNDGSESWSQGNHNMNLSMRPSDMDDSESDHTSEIKPYISFSEGSESSCRGTVDMNAMNQALALVSNDQMSIPSQSPSQETQSAGKICVCQLCHLTFTAYSSLRRHMARHYTDRERYACDVCHKSYSRKDYLKEHKKLKHQINNN